MNFNRLLGLSSSMGLDLPSGPFPSHFPTKILCMFIIPTHIIITDSVRIKAGFCEDGNEYLCFMKGTVFLD
jgi:hypothetical protein